MLEFLVVLGLVNFWAGFGSGFWLVLLLTLFEFWD